MLLKKGGLETMLLQLEEVVAAGFDAHHFVTGLGHHLRNLMVCKDESTLGLMEAGESVVERFQRTGETLWFALFGRCHWPGQ